MKTIMLLVALMFISGNITAQVDTGTDNIDWTKRIKTFAFKISDKVAIAVIEKRNDATDELMETYRAEYKDIIDDPETPEDEERNDWTNIIDILVNATTKANLISAIETYTKNNWQYLKRN